MEWVGTDVSRLDILVENVFGESIQLHREHLLGDILMKRPVIVRYTWPAQYVVETVIIILFLPGTWLGRKERYVWLLMSILAFNLVLHVLLGFAINEVYIMAAHWLFVVPLTMAWLLKDCHYGLSAALSWLLAPSLSDMASSCQIIRSVFSSSSIYGNGY